MEERVCSICEQIITGTLRDLILHRNENHRETINKESLRRTRKRSIFKISRTMKSLNNSESISRKKLLAMIRTLELENESLRKQISNFFNYTTKTAGEDSFYLSPSWRKTRYDALRIHISKHGKRCLLCGSNSNPLHVDHIIPRSIRPDLSLNLNNLQILCQECNLGKSNLDCTDFRKTELIKNPAFSV